MLACPRCSKQNLSKKQTTKGYLFECGKCEGRALSFELQKTIGGESAFHAFLGLLNASTIVTSLICPSCRDHMAGLQLADERVALEACRSCEVTWFDRAEFEHYQKPTDQGLQLGWIDQMWKLIPGILRLPVEQTNPLVSTPWMTFVLILVMAIIFVISAGNLDSAVTTFGFIPQSAFRDFGLTFFSSVFMHGSWGHLLSNAYILLIFGDNVEDRFSHRFYLLLFLIAGAAGAIAHWAFDPRAEMPLVGASGAISGVMTVYCLSFPKARLATFLYVRWLSYPAWGFVLIWLALQLIGLMQQSSGFTMVSYAAHLGGAITGLFFYLGMKDRAGFKLR